MQHHNLPCDEQDPIVALLELILINQGKIMATLQDDLNLATSEGAAIAALVTAFNNVQTQLASILAGNLPDAVQAQVDALFAQETANVNAATAPLSPAPAVPAPAPAADGSV